MKHVFLNDGKPLPADHKKFPGQLAVELTFEDNTKQMIYAADQDQMFAKVLSMYGNTRARVQELKKTPETPKPAPVVVTAEQLQAAAADINDPAKAGPAIVTLVKAHTGLDLDAIRKKQEEDALIAQRRAVAEEFVGLHPEYYGSARNGQLLRDRVAALYGIDHATAANYAEAFADLQAIGALESAPAVTETQPATAPVEPSAPAPARSAGTGIPPARMGSGATPATGQGLTREQVFALTPSEFERRLSTEKGFADKVNALFPNGL